MSDTILWILMTAALLVLISPSFMVTEPFKDLDGWLTKTSTEAINAAPSTARLSRNVFFMLFSIFLFSFKTGGLRQNLFVFATIKWFGYRAKTPPKLAIAWHFLHW